MHNEKGQRLCPVNQIVLIKFLQHTASWIYVLFTKSTLFFSLYFVICNPVISKLVYMHIYMFALRKQFSRIRKFSCTMRFQKTGNIVSNCNYFFYFLEYQGFFWQKCTGASKDIMRELKLIYSFLDIILIYFVSSTM